MRANPTASTIRRAASLCKWIGNPPKATHWFSVAESRTVFAFAGIWRLWRDERQVRAVSIKSMLFDYSVDQRLVARQGTMQRLLAGDAKLRQKPSNRNAAQHDLEFVLDQLGDHLAGPQREG
ncbi:MAG: hypothetical protein M3Z96_03505 [Pseudomonadota bacterium]|nr:hypothetical protein [Pseudomonadota bacterium]